MKVVILAGGFGTRISEESQFKPKPMIEIGNMPILWHIMKLYSFYGFNEFIICAGYKQEIIKKWFADYFLYTSDITFDFTSDNNDNNEMINSHSLNANAIINNLVNKVIVHNRHSEPWKVTVVNTGLNTMTGGRIKRIGKYLNNEAFLMTYGDGVCDVNINKLIAHHKEHGKLATLTAVQPEGRFGIMDMDGDIVCSFREKSKKDSGWINGGFMVLEPEVLDYIRDDTTSFEKEPLEELANNGELINYKHYGFWQCMDTLRDKQKLEDLWASGEAPWKVWK